MFRNTDDAMKVVGRGGDVFRGPKNVGLLPPKTKEYYDKLEADQIEQKALDDFKNKVRMITRDYIEKCVEYGDVAETEFVSCAYGGLEDCVERLEVSEMAPFVNKMIIEEHEFQAFGYLFNAIRKREELNNEK